MKFNLINIDNWDRKPYFEHFLNHTTCTFSITANIDITQLLQQLRKKNIKFYPTFIYMVTRIINAHEEFRTCFDEQDRLGYWDELIPSFTIFHNDNKTFSNMWTEYSSDFDTFYQNYLEDMELYGAIKEMTSKKFQPKNTLPISSIPWVSFTGFNLNIINDGRYLLPIITSGRYFEQENKIFLPLSLQVHHSVCDGYHSSIFLNELQQLADNFGEWLYIREH
ncbi:MULTISPECIES: type A chloramphenicol O-acetyltransferase [Lysinibacillus]|uniref:Chloramphenicol acetyltransferase n=1 Tax=Lysinibacillus tabacifolii TaxID=1173107 RepID=A0ABY2T206_9BACI|nr:type A chloramphenicol O-acetyltransferase [Lysinibacillus tabacifolii]TKI47913.1 type A chloramphenicol O-acetyltransferase [Lysinibacillus tabacifolii]